MEGRMEGVRGETETRRGGGHRKGGQRRDEVAEKGGLCVCAGKIKACGE